MLTDRKREGGGWQRENAAQSANLFANHKCFALSAQSEAPVGLELCHVGRFAGSDDSLFQIKACAQIDNQWYIAKARRMQQDNVAAHGMAEQTRDAKLMLRSKPLPHVLQLLNLLINEKTVSVQFVRIWW